MAVKGACENTEHVEFQTLPAIKAASCIVKGSYTQLTDAAAAAMAWMRDNGYTMNGAMFCIFM